VNLAMTLARQGKTAEAIGMYREGLAALEQLSGAFPQAPRVVEELGDVYATLAFAQIAGSKAEAAESFRTAAALYKQLATRYPKSARYPREQARLLTNIGVLELEQQHAEPAEAAFLEAVVALREAIARGFPRADLAKAVDLAPLTGRADFQKLIAGE
jgi:tetratricopeptide (TPR) repeat protein